MRAIRVLFSAAVFLLFSASIALAQATIAGVVRDSSGAILPGVTVEASSPSLTEKARTAVTDGTGQYRIVTLPPGDYVLTFTPGVMFSNAPAARVSGSVWIVSL